MLLTLVRRGMFFYKSVEVWKKNTTCIFKTVMLLLCIYSLAIQLYHLKKAYCYKFDTLLYWSRSYTISCIWQGKNASFEFIMENCSDVFEIEKQSGRIKVKASSLLDIETHQSFKCQVSSTSLLDLS